VVSKKTKFTEDRNTFIGASEIGSLVAPNDWYTPHKLWMVKTGRKVVEETCAMRMGKYLEPFILREGVAKAKDSGYRIKCVTANKKTFLDPKSKLGATPDAFGKICIDGELKDCVIETKFANDYSGDQFGKEGSDQVPDAYACQVIVQMLCCNVEYGLLFAQISNRKTAVFKIELTEETRAVQQICRDASNVFWANNIVKDLPPKLTGFDTDSQYVKERYSYDDGTMTNADEEHAYIAGELIQLQEAMKDLSVNVEERKNALKNFMGEAKALETEHGTFTWATNAKGSRVFRLKEKAS